MIDTNNFMIKTGVRTFEAAAYLRRAGADVTRVRKLFRDDVYEYKAKADCVRRAEVYRGSYAISKCEPGPEVVSPTVIGAQAANEMLGIKGIKASFVFTEYQGLINLSARSIDEANVQVVMERLGGGGHMNVAACQFEGVAVEDAMNRLKEVIAITIRKGFCIVFECISIPCRKPIRPPKIFIIHITATFIANDTVNRRPFILGSSALFAMYFFTYATVRYMIIITSIFE